LIASSACPAEVDVPAFRLPGSALVISEDHEDGASSWIGRPNHGVDVVAK
jgi:hypothetical protein